MMIEARPPDGFENLPERVQQVLTLVAVGFTPASIARLSGTTTQNVANLVSRYDPDHKFYVTPAERRGFLAKILESKMLEALVHITPEKLEAATATELAAVVASGSKVVRNLGPPPSQTPRDPRDLIQRLLSAEPPPA